MAKKLTGWFLPTFLAVLGIFAFMLPTLAASQPNPTLLQIQDAQAYQNARINGDQLYLITYDTEFAATPSQGADQLFIFRLLAENGTEITSTTPYAYNDKGYGLGVVAFYLTPDIAPTWGNNLTVQLIGNPFITWDDGLPSTTYTAIGWNSAEMAATQMRISARIVNLAQQLGAAWNVTMVQNIQGLIILNDKGIAYFQYAIPYLAEVAPLAVGQYNFNPQYPYPKPNANTYITTITDALKGTLFDLRGPARDLGISWGLLVAILWYGFIAFFFIKLQSHKRMTKGTMLLMWPLVVAGIFFGVPYYITILAAFGCLIATVWVIYSKSYQ
jgi:hypothetical protein